MLTKTILFACLAWGLFSTVQTAKTVRQCEKKLPASLKAKLCEIRQYKIVKGAGMNQHMDCVLKALEFVDADGSADYHKLYEPMNAVEKDRKHDLNLETCQGKAMKAKKKRRANVFYKCMLRSTSADAFKKVFDLTELVKAGKLQATEPYGPKVEKMMKKIDAKVCK